MKQGHNTLCSNAEQVASGSIEEITAPGSGLIFIWKYQRYIITGAREI